MRVLVLYARTGVVGTLVLFTTYAPRSCMHGGAVLSMHPIVSCALMLHAPLCCIRAGLVRPGVIYGRWCSIPAKHGCMRARSVCTRELYTRT